MKTILPSLRLANRLIGPREYDPETDYRFTSLCLTIPVSEGTLLYHTLLGTLLLLEPGEKAEDHLAELVKMSFFVPAEFDETLEARQTVEIGRLLAKKGPRTEFTILTTTDCNARCFYCYEMGRSRIPMSEETAHDVAAYIARVSEGQPVKIHWFGGEPLMNRRVIEIITNELHARKVPFTSAMTTNGYYLDRETVGTAVRNWGLHKVQITLDGTRENYGRIKAYVERDENAFDRVLDHIEYALEAGIEADVRLNMDAANAADLFKLAKILGERFAGRENLYVYARLLGEFKGKIHAFASEEAAAEEFFRLTDLLNSYGFVRKATLPRSMRLNSCMADNDASELIAPDGSVGRCEHFSETEFTGSIYSETRDEALTAAWKELFAPYPECRTCPVFPDCTQLKRCDWTKSECALSDRLIRIRTLTEKVMNTYEQVKSGGEAI